jgi:cell division protein FtsB
MYMFLPFLTALLATVCIWYERRVLALSFTGITLVLLLVWFQFHATTHLKISL